MNTEKLRKMQKLKSWKLSDANDGDILAFDNYTIDF